MSEEIFKKIISVNFAHHVHDMPSALKAKKCEMNAKRMLMSGAAMKAYANDANERKKQVVEGIQVLLESFWKNDNDKLHELPNLAIKEIKPIFEQLDNLVKECIRGPIYAKLTRAIEDIETMLSQETESSLNKIKDIAEIIVAGYSPTPSVATGSGNDQSVNVGDNFKGSLLIGSQVHGDLNNNIEIINESNPDLAHALESITKILDKQLKDDPNKHKEGIEVLSSIAEEGAKPDKDQRKGVIKSGLNCLSSLSKTIKDTETVQAAIDAMLKIFQIG